MLIQLVLALLLGIGLGAISGLTPGIHINMIGTLAVSLFFSVFYNISEIYFIVFVVSMTFSHIFIDFIPSIFLGCPNEDTILTVLPGHELLLEGKGLQAIKLACLGTLLGIVILVVFSIPLSFLILPIYTKIKILVPFILLLVAISLVFSEKKKFSAFLIFSLTGVLGLITLNINIREPLLPLLTGLFGASSLISSIKEKPKIPSQNSDEKIALGKMEIFKNSFSALLAAPLSVFLPAVSSSQIAIIGNSIAKNDKKGFLFLQGIVSSLTMGFSFLALLTISKTRTGSAVAIEKLVGALSMKIFILILIISLLTGIISFFLSLKLSRLFLKLISYFNYSKLTIFILCFLTFIICLFSGIPGLFLFLVSSLTGYYAISLGVRRTNMMGCLLVPSIFLLLM